MAKDKHVDSTGKKVVTIHDANALNEYMINHVGRDWMTQPQAIKTYGREQLDELYG